MPAITPIYPGVERQPETISNVENDDAALILEKLKTVDGASSGLDADLLDGQHGSFYTNRANHTGTFAPSNIFPQGAASTLDADLLDGQHGSYYTLRANHTGTFASGGYSNDDSIPAYLRLDKGANTAVKIHRFQDRALFGDAVNYTGKFSSYGDLGTSKLTEATSYFATNASVIVGGVTGRYGLTAYGVSDSSAETDGLANTESIGIAAVGISKAGTGYARGIYAEGLFFSPTGLASAAEFQVGNHSTVDHAKSSAYGVRGATCLYMGAEGYVNYTKGNTQIKLTPAVTGATGNGTTATLTIQSPHEFQIGDVITVFGVTPSGYNGTFTLTGRTSTTISYASATSSAFVSGGYTARAYPSGQCIDISGGSIGATWQKFKVGMVFRNGALVRDSVTDRADAIHMAQKHQIVWDVSDATTRAAVIRSEINAASSEAWQVFKNHLVEFQGTSEAVILQVKNDSSGTPVNYAIIQNAPTGGPVYMQATGSDTNVNFAIYTKGEASIFTVRGDNGADEWLRVSGATSNVNYAHISGSATGSAITISAAGSDTNIPLDLRSKGSSPVRAMAHAGSVEVSRFSANTSNAVNGLDFRAYATGSSPQIQAFGSDANLDLILVPKGTGRLQIQTATTAATTAASFTADRILEFKDSSGTTYRIPCRATAW